MAVSNPATLVSICDELGLVGANRSFRDAISTELENPDFFIGKDKNSMKDWAGYINIRPTIEIELVYLEQTPGILETLTSISGTLSITTIAHGAKTYDLDKYLFKSSETLGLFKGTLIFPSSVTGDQITSVSLENIVYRFDDSTGINLITSRVVSPIFIGPDVLYKNGRVYSLTNFTLGESEPSLPFLFAESKILE